MTTPSDNVPASIIQDAYFDAGLIQEGQTVNSEQTVNGMRKLTDLINLWQTQGLKLWMQQDLSVTLVAGTATYTLGLAGTVVMAKPTQVTDAYYQDANGVRRPLTPLAWTDWVRLSQITQQGAINSYFVDKQQALLSVSFWLVPDTTAALGTGHLIIRRQVTGFTNVTEDMNFPSEWRIALRWGLADELATGQPQAIMDRCQQRAMAYRTALEDFDVEDVPVRFTAGGRSYAAPRSFR